MAGLTLGWKRRILPGVALDGSAIIGSVVAWAGASSEIWPWQQWIDGPAALATPARDVLSQSSDGRQGTQAGRGESATSSVLSWLVRDVSAEAGLRPVSDP